MPINDSEQPPGQQPSWLKRFFEPRKQPKSLPQPTPPQDAPRKIVTVEQFLGNLIPQYLPSTDDPQLAREGRKPTPSPAYLLHVAGDLPDTPVLRDLVRTQVEQETNARSMDSISEALGLGKNPWPEGKVSENQAVLYLPIGRTPPDIVNQIRDALHSQLDLEKLSGQEQPNLNRLLTRVIAESAARLEINFRDRPEAAGSWGQTEKPNVELLRSDMNPTLEVEFRLNSMLADTDAQNTLRDALAASIQSGIENAKQLHVIEEVKKTEVAPKPLIGEAAKANAVLENLQSTFASCITAQDNDLLHTAEGTGIESHGHIPLEIVSITAEDLPLWRDLLRKRLGETGQIVTAPEELLPDPLKPELHLDSAVDVSDTIRAVSAIEAPLVVGQPQRDQYGQPGEPTPPNEPLTNKLQSIEWDKLDSKQKEEIRRQLLGFIGERIATVQITPRLLATDELNSLPRPERYPLVSSEKNPTAVVMVQFDQSWKSPTFRNLLLKVIRDATLAANPVTERITRQTIDNSFAQIQSSTRTIPLREPSTYEHTGFSVVALDHIARASQEAGLPLAIAEFPEIHLTPGEFHRAMHADEDSQRRFVNAQSLREQYTPRFLRNQEGHIQSEEFGNQEEVYAIFQEYQKRNVSLPDLMSYMVEVKTVKCYRMLDRIHTTKERMKPTLAKNPQEQWAIDMLREDVQKFGAFLLTDWGHRNLLLDILGKVPTDQGLSTKIHDAVIRSLQSPYAAKLVKDS